MTIPLFSEAKNNILLILRKQYSVNFNILLGESDLVG